MARGKAKFGLGTAVFAVVCIAAILVASAQAWGRKHLRPDNFDQIFNELTAVPATFRNLSPDPTGNYLAYVRGSDMGRALFLLDLKSLKVTRIETTNEVTQVFGWSPDGRFLAISEAEPTNLDENHVYIFDKAASSLTAVIGTRGYNERWFDWLETNRYYIAGQNTEGTNKDISRFVGNWADRVPQKVVTYLQDFTPMSEHEGAFIYQGNIKGCQIDSLKNPPVTTYSRFASDQFDSIPGNWLRYERESGVFFFCGVPKGSEWRYAYSLNPKGSVLKQLTDGDTYNCQPLADGKGFAYVGNISNHFHLAVRPQDTNGNTNLFVNGTVVNYVVGPFGDNIYITAAEDIEPHSLWEYDVTARRLRRLVPGVESPFVATVSIEPREMRLTADDGVQFTTFVYMPLDVPRVRKHPLLLAVPAPSAQAQKSFEVKTQLLPNVGFEIALVNYRGVDGYGQRFAALKSDANGVEDVISAYRELAKGPDLDTNNVFLFDTSGGSAVTTELLRVYPSLWRGLMLDHSSLSLENLDPSLIPQIFYVTGDQDGVLQDMQHLEIWAKSNNLQVSGVVIPHCGHINRMVGAAREVERLGIDFIYHNLH